MAKMVWKDEYSVGKETLDAQHERLIDLFNRLDGDEPLDRVLAELDRYADEHFRDEEGLLKAADYPDVARHRAHHKAFRAWLDRTREPRRSVNGCSATRGDVRAYLRVWIPNHLLVHDSAYKSWLD